MSTNDQRNRRKYPTYVVNTATAQALSEIGEGIDPFDIPQMRSTRRRLPTDLVDQLHEDGEIMNAEVQGFVYSEGDDINEKALNRFMKGVQLERSF